MNRTFSFVAINSFLLAGFTGLAFAQAPAQLPQTLNTAAISRISGTTHPLVKTASEVGRVDGALPMNRMLLVLNSTPAQGAELENLIAAQHNPSSPQYRKWLTPRQFGERFAPALQDTDTIAAWLRSQGFHVDNVAAGRRSIEFSGSAAQVEQAFHTEMHRYSVNGRQHIANSTDIAIPASLAGVVAGVQSLNDFHAVPLHHSVTLPNRGVRTGSAAPAFDSGGGGYYLAPGDFATIYNVAPLYNTGVTGTGQTIAVVGRTNFNMSDIATFRSTFGLPGNNTQIIVNGSNPGIISQDEEIEALLDVQWSGAVAKGAAIDFVLSANTNTTGGETLSSQYIVDNNLASVMTTSFGLCEVLLGPSNQFYNALWQQAAAEGISVMAAAGDSGAAGCDVPSGTTPATQGLAVNGIASTPYNTAVGGTELNEYGAYSTYWAASNNPTTQASALSYIPEVVWNDSAYISAGNASNNLYAGSGGVSSLYATPIWQTGAGVPSVDPNTANAHHRYIPDISLSAAGHDAYIIVLNGGLVGVGGTSAGAPSFAGIMALVNQHTGARVGNPATTLYSLASTAPSAFHDVVTGTNAVPCSNGSPNCTPGANGVGVTSGWAAAAGYDLATGLGSVNALNLVMNWPAGTQQAPVITSLSPNPMTGSATAQTLTIAGSGFLNGLKVVLTASGVSTTYSGAQIASITSSQIQLPVIVGTAAETVSVQVTNSTGPASNIATFTVTAPVAPPPVLTSLNPNPITFSASAQTLTLNGSGFVNANGLEIVVTSSTATLVLQKSRITFVSSSQLQVSLGGGTAVGTYGIQVINPSGQTSAIVNLVIQATAPTGPVITSLNPTSLPRSNNSQELLIFGTGFQSGFTVRFTLNGSLVSLPIARTYYVSTTEVAVSVDVGTTAETLGVQVVNPNAQASNVASLTVN